MKASAVAGCVLVAALAAPAAPAKPLPFTTVATGTAAPDAAALRPEAFLSTDSRFVYVYAYGGRVPSHDHRVTIGSVTLTRGTLVVRAAWGTPRIPYIVHPGDAVPYQFIRIRRRAIRGKVPRSALLVQVQAGLHPHTRLADLMSLVVTAATRLRSASLLGHNELTEWLGGTHWFDTPTWYLSVAGNAACGPYNASTGYYLADDRTGTILGCGIP